MAFSGIYFNNKEYNQMWFEGNLVWQKGEIDYSQRINLEQVGSKYDSQQYDLRFEDYDDYASPYWVSFNNNAGKYIESGISIPIPSIINTEYVLIKGIIKANLNLASIYIEGAKSIKLAKEEIASFSYSAYYEFEALVNISNMSKVGIYIYDATSYIGSAIGNITMQPIVSATSTYAKLVKEANYPYIRSITLESSLTDTTIIQGTTFTITPTVLPTNYVGDEIVVTYDTNYLSYDGTTFTVIDTATFGEETTITYSSKLNPSASTTYTIKVKEYVPITSIVLSHNLDIPLTDVPIHTTFTITPIIEPSDYTLSDLQVVYNPDYLITDDNMTFTILEIAEGQVLDIAYMGKTNSIVKSISLTVSGVAYPYPEVDSVVTYVNTSTTSAYSRTFTVIDSTLPYSINGVETTSFSFPPNVETQVKLVNLKPCYGGDYVYPTKYEQLRIPNLTDLSYLFGYFAYQDRYEYSWQPQYFELTTNPTSMRSMFMGCKYLTDEMMEQFMPIMSKFDTSQITDMCYLIQQCTSLTKLDLTSFDMTNVVNKNAMLTGFDGTIRVNKDKWLSDTYHCSYGATDATFILVDELGAEEEVYKPLYRTEFGATANLPTWVSKFSSNTYDFNYSSSGYYSGNVTSYYDADASTTFRVVAPITGDLIVYTSAYKNTQYDSLTIKSNGSQVAQYKYHETEYIYSSKYQTTSIPVVEGQEYLIQLDYVQGINDRYGNTYLHGFSVDHYVVTSISLSHNIEDITDVTLPFVITPTITTTGLNGYHSNDLEIIYDENYISVDSSTNLVTLLDGGQGQTVSITYRSKTDNSISDTITVTLGEYSGVSTGGLQPLKEWKADLVPLEWDSLYTNYRTANATVTYNLEERSAKISVTAKYNSYANICLKMGDNYTSIFDSTKYYKLSYKVRGKDTNGYSSYSSYSSQIYDGSTYTKYTNADNLLDETEWREENYVVYGITRFDVRCTYGDSKNWIEIKDVMYQVYDEAPALPDIPIYQVASNEFSLVNMYKDGLATASSKYNTITVDDVNDYFTIKVNTNAKVSYMSASLSLPIGRFYTISGLGACYVSTGSNPMLWSLYNYESDRYSLKNVGGLTTSSNPDIATTENMREVYMEEDKTNIDYLKNIYSRSLNGVLVRYIGFWLDSNITTSYFIKFANLTIKEQE